MTERTIFLDALEKTDPAERAAFLEQACGENALLRQRVEQLIKAFDEAGSFMAAPPGQELAPIGPAQTNANGSPPSFSVPRPVVEGPGDRDRALQTARENRRRRHGRRLHGRAGGAGPPQGRAQDHQAGDGLAATSSPGSRPSARPSP